MPKSMNAMLAILGGPVSGKSRSCPECDSPMESDGTCSECGYGEEEEYEEEGEDDGHMERMVEIRDDLQRLVDKLSKLIS